MSIRFINVVSEQFAINQIPLKIYLINAKHLIFLFQFVKLGCALSRIIKLFPIDFTTYVHADLLLYYVTLVNVDCPFYLTHVIFEVLI